MCRALREFQWKNRVSDKQLSATLEIIKEIGDLLRSGSAELPANIRVTDTPLRQKVMTMLCVVDEHDHFIHDLCL